MSELNPITREEVLLDSVANGTPSNLTPITRQEQYLSAIAGESDLPADMEPITREEIYYQKILDNGGAGGGGGEATGTKTINITSNGTTSHNVKAYATAQIITNVPNPSTGTKQITANGSHDVTDYASAQVNVPNSYSASDEGKVVSNGELTAQTSRQITQNGTVDTTLNDEVVVNVPTGITPSGSQEFTQNGTYNVSSLAEAVVNVASGGGVAKAEGTVTLANDANFPTITHNLGTKKVAIVIYPIADVIPHGNYRNWIYECVNYPAILEGTTFNLDYRQYNSTKFPDIVQVDVDEDRFRVANGNVSPATSQSNWYQGTMSSDIQSTVSFTDNSVTITGSFASSTYKWIVYALE